MSDNPREYRLGDPGEPIGPPTATPDPEAPACPNCGCAAIHKIQVRVRNPLLRHGHGLATYFGCPACPWASPAITATTPDPDQN